MQRSVDSTIRQPLLSEISSLIVGLIMHKEQSVPADDRSCSRSGHFSFGKKRVLIRGRSNGNRKWRRGTGKNYAKDILDPVI